MDKKQFEKISWLAICTAYRAYLDYKLCEDIPMNTIEIELMHYEPEKIAEYDNKYIIEEINKFDIYKVFK